MRRTARMTDLLRSRGRALVFAGAAAALAGAGAVSASTAAFGAAAAQPATHAPAATPAHAGPISLSALAGRPAGARLPMPTARAASAAHAQQSKPGADHRTAISHQPWARVQAIMARESRPTTASGQQAMADQLRPVAASGPQEYMPMTPARMANATTIVKQDIAAKMGLRSAVIAVATSMQESTLQNINYGTSDSVGLFQQRPSCGWGTVSQLTDPAYAARAFLTALHSYEAKDPDWASQPLWQSAQGVQASGYPTAYAKWEAQAANVVQDITTHLV